MVKQSEKEDAISYAVSAAFLFTRENKPGVMFMKFPQRIKDILAKLTSDDWSRIRYI